ncbi:hypothetical protein OYT1_ch1719 [Ferriphaselus amnicola]|uniref:Uncharacterized protein n=1 Tax=Ferriphaselus amnicola TaxID=1188319 RepID=A0A2Z6GCS9_9PROT|nr:hypothetical protein [Ferriphaselus amnicola]BBE51257.1 hypothetical protein OYT1_ch1719 [Ferriphaselus amnicola]
MLSAHYEFGSSYSVFGFPQLWKFSVESWVGYTVHPANPSISLTMFRQFALSLNGSKPSTQAPVRLSAGAA